MISTHRCLLVAPIDPSVLTLLSAKKADIGTTLIELETAGSCYRFEHLLQRANEFCQDVIGLGGSLLSILEKVDAESISLLRGSHETALLENARTIRSSAIEEAKKSITALERSLELAQQRRDFYRVRILLGISPLEFHQLSIMSASLPSLATTKTRGKNAAGADSSPEKKRICMGEDKTAPLGR